MIRFLTFPDKLLATRADLGLLALRIALGVVFIYHGGTKLFVRGIDGTAAGFEKLGIPLPELNAVLATAAELGGGIAVLIGLATRWASIPLAFTMMVAFITAKNWRVFANYKDGGFEYVFVLFMICLTLLFAGAGRYSVDHQLIKKLD
jgi:putative oxidoreductase